MLHKATKQTLTSFFFVAVSHALHSGCPVDYDFEAHIQWPGGLMKCLLHRDTDAFSKIRISRQVRQVSKGTFFATVWNRQQQRNAFGQKLTNRFGIRIQTLTIRLWNDLDLKNCLDLEMILTLMIILIQVDQSKRIWCPTVQETHFTKVTLTLTNDLDIQST